MQTIRVLLPRHQGAHDFGKPTKALYEVATEHLYTSIRPVVGNAGSVHTVVLHVIVQVVRV